MADPNGAPVVAGFPVPPPPMQLEWTTRGPDGLTRLTPPAMDFLQKLWAAVQGSGGVIDIGLLTAMTPGAIQAGARPIADEAAQEALLLAPRPAGSYPGGAVGQLQYNAGGIFGGGDLSGDVTTSGGLVTTLDASGVTAGTYGDATNVGQFTVDAKGRITSAINVPISGGGGGVTSFNTRTGAIVVAAGSGISITESPTNTFTIDATGGGSGTVTSVAMTMPAIFSVAGSPITTSGTLAVTLANESANQVWAGPTTGAAAAPTFRSLVVADLPNNGADPTATASDTAVNGTATTFMRSDAAPAIQLTSASQFGLCKVDGSTITETGGVISASGGSSGALVLISEQTPSGTATVSFTSIPATYRDLVVIVRGRAAATAVASSIGLQFNGDTGANYFRQRLTGNNATASAAIAVAVTSMDIGNILAATATANFASGTEITIYDYRGTTFTKVAFSQMTYPETAAAAGQFVEIRSGGWNNTNAITQVDVICGSNFVSGSVVSLYGRF